MRDKVVIITGGSAGIGAAAARYFAQRGAKLVLVGRRPEPLQQLADELAAETEVLALALDVADRSQWAALFEQSMARFGRIDVLVNNAGLHRRGDVANNDCDDLVQMMDVNLTAPIALSRLAIPYLRQSGGGARSRDGRHLVRRQRNAGPGAQTLDRRRSDSRGRGVDRCRRRARPQPWQ